MTSHAMPLLALSTVLACLSSVDAQQPPQIQQVTGNKWAVRFEIERKDLIREPQIHIGLLITAESEGDAVMKGVMVLQQHLSVGSVDRLKFVEAQRKE